jgi:tRNA threonylcarbamoyl adenosine modification protein YeaZ
LKPKDLLIDSISSINTDIMSFLSIDCSTEIGSLFVKIKSKTFSKILQSDKFNNDLLMKNILDFFNKNDLKFDNLSKIYVNQGPGNFSGLRGSLAIAKGISLSKNIDLYGYNTFIWSCASFIKKKIPIYSLVIFRETYFIKKFDGSFADLSKPKKTSIEEIIKKYSKKNIVIPKKFISNFNDKLLKLDNLNAVNLDHNELESLQLKGLMNKELIKPLYLN